MNRRSREGFQAIWLAAVMLCAVIAVFCAILVSCTKASGSPPAPKTQTEDSAILPDDTGD